MTYRYFYHTNNKARRLAHSHYSDPAFKNEAVIFGEKRNDLEYVYADRLRMWDADKADEAWEIATNECGKAFTARKIERYLQAYYDDNSIDVVVVLSGTQPFNGYPWHAYGFKRGTA